MSNELPASSMVLLAARPQRREKGEYQYAPLEMTPGGGLKVASMYPRVGPSLHTLASGKSLRAVLGGAITTAQPTWSVNYSEVTDSSLVEDSVEGALNSTTEVVLLPSPSTNFKRMVQQIVICNGDTKPVYLDLYLYESTAKYLLRSWALDSYVTMIWTPYHFTITPGSIIP
jgi:hypothetical protein